MTAETPTAADWTWQNDPDVISWDHRQGPDLDELAEVLARHGATLAEVDTGADDVAVRISSWPVEAMEDALCRRVWAAALRYAAEKFGFGSDSHPARLSLLGWAARVEAGTLTPWADGQPAGPDHPGRLYPRGDGPCGDCGTTENIIWFTESVFWNRIMRRPDGSDEAGGIVCVPCFVARVHAAGLEPTGWRLLPEWHWETTEERHARRGGPDHDGDHAPAAGNRPADPPSSPAEPPAAPGPHPGTPEFAHDDQTALGIPLVVDPSLPEDSWRLVAADGAPSTRMAPEGQRPILGRAIIDARGVPWRTADPHMVAYIRDNHGPAQDAVLVTPAGARIIEAAVAWAATDGVTDDPASDDLLDAVTDAVGAASLLVAMRGGAATGDHPAGPAPASPAPTESERLVEQAYAAMREAQQARDGARAELAEVTAELEELRRDRIVSVVMAHHRGAPRPFVLNRRTDTTGVSGTGVVAEGCAFNDGSAVLRWLSDWPTSVVFHDRGIEAIEQVHGHGGQTQIVWCSEELQPLADMEQERDEARAQVSSLEEELVTARSELDRWVGRFESALATAHRDGAADALDYGAAWVRRVFADGIDPEVAKCLEALAYGVRAGTRQVPASGEGGR